MTSDPLPLIQQLIHRYARAVDRREAGAAASLFDEEGELRVMGETHHGRPAIEKWVSELRPPNRQGRHLNVNTVAQSVSSDAVVTSTDFVFLSADDGHPWQIAAVGCYEDEFVHRADQWVFQTRCIDLVPAPGVPA